jgi:hypothetical protein
MRPSLDVARGLFDYVEISQGIVHFCTQIMLLRRKDKILLQIPHQ